MTGITGAIRAEMGEQLRFEDRFEGGEDLVVAGSSAGTDVEIVVVGVGEGGDVGVDDVVNVDVIPSVQAITEDGGSFVLEKLGGEDGDDTGFAVAGLAGAVDVGVAEGNPGEVVDFTHEFEI